MAIYAPIRGCWMRATRLRRAWRSRLRRPGALVALLLVCALGLGGPLVCILHCEILLPLAPQQYTTRHHHHHHMPATGAAGANDMPFPAASEAIEPSPGQAPAPCFALHGSGSAPGSPLPLPPSPVYEMIAALGAPLALAPLIVYVLEASTRAPRRVAFPPPLHPPIPFAG